MKRALLLMTTSFILAAQSTWSQGTQFDPDIDASTMRPVIHADMVQMGCSYYIRMQVDPQSPPPGDLYVSVFVAGGSIVYYNPNFPRNTVVYVNTQAVAPTTYNIYATDHNGLYYYYEQSATLSITPPCVISSVATDWSYNPQTQTSGYVSYPVDPYELETMPEMEVRWKLEELDNETWEPVFTLENPAAWEASNHPGASNSFNGFNAYDPASIAQLQSGELSSDPGIFDPLKVYRITRSYRVKGGTVWTDYSAIVGSGDDDRDGGKGKKKPRSMHTIQTDSEELKVGMDATAQIAIFHASAKKGQLYVYDISGKQIAVIVMEDGFSQYELDVSGLAKGAYILKMESETQILTKKFVVE